MTVAISDSRATSHFHARTRPDTNTGGPPRSACDAGRPAAERIAAGGKGGLDPMERLFLRIDIEACCNGLDHQERTALVGETHTPSCIAGCACALNAPISRSISPVGSAAMLRLTSMPNADPSNWTSESSAACSAAGVKCSGTTAALSSSGCATARRDPGQMQLHRHW